MKLIEQLLIKQTSAVVMDYRQTEKNIFKFNSKMLL